MMKHGPVLGAILAFSWGLNPAAAQTSSVAHERSKSAVVDPAYDAKKVFPAPDVKEGGAPWIYGEAELECWRHLLARERSAEACREVNYPGEYHTPSPRASFRREFPSPSTWPPTLTVFAVGDIVFSAGDRVLLRAKAADGPHKIDVPRDLPAGPVTVRVDLTTSREPPALLIEQKPAATDASWAWSADGASWGPVRDFPQTRSGIPPHRVEDPEVNLVPVGMAGALYDFGRDILGVPVFRCGGTPTLAVGESTAEALLPAADERRGEYRYGLVQQEDGFWAGKWKYAFRYLRIDGGPASDVSCRAAFHPVRYRGAFACSDPQLTRVWMVGAYTLRANMHDFSLDGIKRDRLPWIGDLASCMAVNAYVFADPEIVRRTITVLGRAGIAGKDVNGIADFSLWWIICHDLFQLYFHDPAFLAREYPRIKEALKVLAGRCDGDGVLSPGSSWLFIDWGVQLNKSYTCTALQILWYWAQVSGARLADRMGDAATAKTCRDRAAALAALLKTRSWSDSAGAWNTYLESPSVARHANVLAALSGLAAADQYEGIRKVLAGTAAPPVQTPFFQGLELRALARMGAGGPVVSKIRSYWGQMLDRGATTFWETFDPSEQGDANYKMYGRPFGRSLCHAWASAPAAVLPGEVLGIRPTADGWKRFTVEPRLGDLDWAAACVPTPSGDIQVQAHQKGARVVIAVPAGAVLELRGKEYRGPTSVTTSAR